MTWADERSYLFAVVAFQTINLSVTDLIMGILNTKQSHLTCLQKKQSDRMPLHTLACTEYIFQFVRFSVL